MIKPPSLQKEYTLIWSGDSALQLPTDTKEATNALRVARETGNWTGLIRAGETPTLFHCLPLNESAKAHYTGERARKQLTVAENAALIFRLGIRRIDNLGDIEVSLERRDGFEIATTDVVNSIGAIDEVGHDILIELAAAIAERTFSTSPKS